MCTTHRDCKRGFLLISQSNEIDVYCVGEHTATLMAMPAPKPKSTAAVHPNGSIVHVCFQDLCKLYPHGDELRNRIFTGHNQPFPSTIYEVLKLFEGVLYQHLSALRNVPLNEAFTNYLKTYCFLAQGTKGYEVSVIP